MYRVLAPMSVAAHAVCHRCLSLLTNGDRAWRVALGDSNRGSLCLVCARAFVVGRPGASAEREAMRRMRSEPVLAAPRPAAVPIAPPPPMPLSPVRSPPLGRTATGTRRWGRLAIQSLAVTLGASALTATGPTGQMLAVLVGFPAVAVFWVSVAAMPVSAARAAWTSRRRGTPVPRRADLPAMTAAAASRAGVGGGHRVRVLGAEDNWVKGARGEQAVGAALSRTGLPVLHDRRLRRGSRANIDHVVVAADAVHVVDAKNIAGSLLVAAGTVRISGRDRSELLEGVRGQAAEVAAALERLGVCVPVRAVLCLTGPAQPAWLQTVGGVLLTNPVTVASALSLPGPLTDDRRAAIADLVAWAFPPAVTG